MIQQQHVMSVIQQNQFGMKQLQDVLHNVPLQLMKMQESVLIVQIFVMNVQLPIIVLNASMDTLNLLELAELPVLLELMLHNFNVSLVLPLAILASELLQIVLAA